MAAGTPKTAVGNSGIKRPISAFLMFCCEKRKDIHKESLSLVESSKILSQMWKSMTEADKQPFVEMSNKDKQRYTDELSRIGKIPYRRKNSSLSSVKKPRKRRNQDTQDEAGPVKKKRARKSSSSVQSALPADPSTSCDSKPGLHNAFLPNVSIPVFTEEFLVHNKKLNSDLMKLRQTNKDLIDQKQRLEDSLQAFDKDVQSLEQMIQKQIMLNDSLEMQLQIARKVVSDFLCELEQSTNKQSSTTEGMLDEIINKERIPLTNENIAKLGNTLYEILPDLVLKD